MLKLNEKQLAEKFCRHEALGQITASDFLRDLSSCSEKIKAKDGRIALCFKDSYLFSVAFFASLILNKKIVLLPNNKLATLQSLRSEYDSVLSDENLTGLVRGSKKQELRIPLSAEINFYTSGSMGTPKKISKRFENLYAEVLVLERVFGALAEKSFVLATVTHQHIYGILFKILWPILNRRCWYSHTIENIEQIQSAAKTIDAFVLVSTPAFLKRSFLPVSNIRNGRLVFSSGGPLPFDISLRISETFNLKPTEIYGSTESGGIAYRQSEVEGQLWTTFPGIQATTNSHGLLLLKGPYFDESELLMADKVQIEGAGFRLLGRSDDVVKIEEKRISLAEINKKILELPWVKDSVVLAAELNARQQTVCLAVVENVDKSADVIQTIRAHLSKYFELSVIPRKFRFLDHLPYSSESKLNRDELLRFFYD